MFIFFQKPALLSCKFEHIQQKMEQENYQNLDEILNSKDKKVIIVLFYPILYISCRHTLILPLFRAHEAQVLNVFLIYQHAKCHQPIEKMLHVQMAYYMPLLLTQSSW